MVHGHRFNFLSINLIKLHNTPQISGLTTIKSIFSTETETTKVLNLFDLHHMLVKDVTIHLNNIFTFLIFFSKSMCFSVNALFIQAYDL